MAKDKDKVLVSVLLDPEEASQLDEIAEKSNRKRSQTVRQFIRTGIDNGPDKPVLVALLVQATNQLEDLEDKLTEKELDGLRKTLASIIKTIK